MPELPEVETVRNTLKTRVIGKKITDIEIYHEKIIKNIDICNFEKKLVNQTITDIRRNGKYLLFDFDDITMVSHLRMEGKYFFHEVKEERTKHDCVIFNFSDGTSLIYNDTRRFGTMEVVNKKEEYDLKSIAKLGLEPNDERLTSSYLKDKIGVKKTKIKVFLLDQTVITGLGNIYVDEVLYKTKIHPETPVNHVTDKELEELVININQTITRAINAGGTTVKSFSIDGKVDGRFQLSLEMYGRKGEECYRCNTIIEKIKVGGRGTCFCPKCQEIE